MYKVLCSPQVYQSLQGLGIICSLGDMLFLMVGQCTNEKICMGMDSRGYHTKNPHVEEAQRRNWQWSLTPINYQIPVSRTTELPLLVKEQILCLAHWALPGSR